MKVIKRDQVAEQQPSSKTFTGPVKLQFLLDQGMAKDYHRVCAISFSRGARPKWHAHTRDQLLVVVAGKGVVVTEAERQVATGGDVVFLPADEKHWHGASEDSDVTYISIEPTGTKVEWLED